VSAQPLWRLVSHPDARLVRFGTEAVVFNPLSWETHLLNETAAHIVETLRGGLRSIQELAAALVADLDPDSPPEVYAEQIALLMEELEDLELVVRDPLESAVPHKAEEAGAREAESAG
jgi:PqqD family protein of HPr-rel-A system